MKTDIIPYQKMTAEAILYKENDPLLRYAIYKAYKYRCAYTGKFLYDYSSVIVKTCSDSLFSIGPVSYTHLSNTEAGPMTKGSRCPHNIWTIIANPMIPNSFCI